MIRDKAIESWLASMNESELIDQCFFWHDTALEQGRMYNAVKAENAKLRELVRDMMVAWWACDNEKCPRHDKRCEEGKFCAFDECARDLGIEVGE